MTDKKILEIDNASYKLKLSSKDLEAKIKEIAENIAADYKVKTSPILLIVTNGAMYFGTSLSMALEDIGFLHKVDTIRIKRYTEDSKTSSEIKIISEPMLKIEDENIIVVEDTVDEGLTLNFLNDYLKLKQASSIEYSVMIIKSNHKPLNFDIKYWILNNVGPEWLVGFGLDSNFLYRGLRAIYSKIS